MINRRRKSPAILFLSDQPHYMVGRIASNSIFQILTYSLYAWVVVTIVPTWFGGEVRSPKSVR